jgi:hypothetical protein
MFEESETFGMLPDNDAPAIYWLFNAVATLEASVSLLVMYV